MVRAYVSWLQCFYQSLLQGIFLGLTAPSNVEISYVVWIIDLSRQAIILDLFVWILIQLHHQLVLSWL